MHPKKLIMLLSISFQLLNTWRFRHTLWSTGLCTVLFASPGRMFSSAQSLSRVRLFATPWTTACQASLSITISRSPPKPMSIESVMPSNHLILCHPLLLLPSIFPSIRVFSKCIRWPKYWSFSFKISPSSEYSGLISFRMDWLDLLAVQGTLYGQSFVTLYRRQGARPSPRKRNAKKH